MAQRSMGWLRFTKGDARYTAGFTAPIGALPAEAN